MDRDDLMQLADAELLSLLEQAHLELVVTPHLGYHLWVHGPLNDGDSISAALIQEVYRRQAQLLAYAEANTVRLRALGYAFDIEPDDDTEGSAP